MLNFNYIIIKTNSKRMLNFFLIKRIQRIFFQLKSPLFNCMEKSEYVSEHSKCTRFKILVFILNIFLYNKKYISQFVKSLDTVHSLYCTAIAVIQINNLCVFGFFGISIRKKKKTLPTSDQKKKKERHWLEETS